MSSLRLNWYLIICTARGFYGILLHVIWTSGEMSAINAFSGGVSLDCVSLEDVW